MDLELKIEKDNLGKKIKMPLEDLDNYCAYAFDGAPQGIVSLSAIVEGRKLMSHYKKNGDVWIKNSLVRSGPLVVGHPVYEEGTSEYEAFEMLNRT